MRFGNVTQYVKYVICQGLTVTNMQMIITKIGCIIGQSCKIRCDVLIHAGVGEPSRNRNILRNWFIGISGYVGRATNMNYADLNAIRFWLFIAQNKAYWRVILESDSSGTILEIIDGHINPAQNWELCCGFSC